MIKVHVKENDIPNSWLIVKWQYTQVAKPKKAAMLFLKGVIFIIIMKRRTP